MTDKADRVLAIIAHLERQGEAEMAEVIRALRIECELLRARESHTRLALRQLIDDLAR